jgi:hypothetical protein
MEIFLIMLALVGSVFWWNYRRFKRMRAQSFDWYAQTYPQHIQDGQARCRECKNSRIHTRKVDNYSLREHFCPNCGVTLYYSPLPE